MELYKLALKSKTFEENLKFIRKLGVSQYDMNTFDAVKVISTEVSKLTEKQEVKKVLWTGFVSEVCGNIDEAAWWVDEMDVLPEFKKLVTFEDYHSGKTIQTNQIEFSSYGNVNSYMDDEHGHFGRPDSMDDFFTEHFAKKYSVHEIKVNYEAYILTMNYTKFVDLLSSIKHSRTTRHLSESIELITKNYCVFSSSDMDIFRLEETLNNCKDFPYSYKSLCTEVYNELEFQGKLKILRESGFREILVVSQKSRCSSEMCSGKNMDDLASRIVRKIPFDENKLGKILMDVRRVCGFNFDH